MTSKGLKPPTQEELNEAYRQLQSRQHNSRLASAPSNGIRNVRAHIPFSQEVMRNASREENKEAYRQARGIETSKRVILSVTGRKRVAAHVAASRSKIGGSPTSTLEKAMMWR